MISNNTNGCPYQYNSTKQSVIRSKFVPNLSSGHKLCPTCRLVTICANLSSGHKLSPTCHIVTICAQPVIWAQIAPILLSGHKLRPTSHHVTNCTQPLIWSQIAPNLSSGHTMHTSERDNSLVTEPWQLHQELCLHWLFCQIRISLSSFKIGGWGVGAKKVATLKSPTGAGV